MGAFVCLANTSIAKKVIGAAEGFAQAIVGGGNAAAVTPRDTKELVACLTDYVPRVIVLDEIYDSTGSEGMIGEKCCSPWGTCNGCQLPIDLNHDWCGSNPFNVNVTYILLAPSCFSQTLMGNGNKGIIKGKGLRFVRAKISIVQIIRKYQNSLDLSARC